VRDLTLCRLPRIASLVVLIVGGNVLVGGVAVGAILIRLAD
jgi:hypothetical protein